MEEIINIRGLKFGYKTGRRRTVLGKDVDFTLHKGEVVALIGRNGVGKSTLLRTISAHQKPLGGEIFLNGKPAKQYTQLEYARTVSVVFTNRLDTDRLSVQEVVEMGRTPYTGILGTLSKADKEAVEDAIRSVGIISLRDRMTETLSDGEQQKVLIAKALAQQTPIILLDEPTSFLDHPSKTELFKLLRHLAHEQGKGILLSTHDLELASQWADRLWELR